MIVLLWAYPLLTLLAFHPFLRPQMWELLVKTLEIDQDIIWDNLAAQEQEARAREHARIYSAVEAINMACER